MPGNRPVSVVAFERLDARTLGSLVALYEHKVFTQSVVWGINAFDQWGVELGKKMCEEVLPLVRDPNAATGTRAMLKPLLESPRAVESMMRRDCVRWRCCSWRRRGAPAAADAGWFESGDVVLRNDLLLLNDAEVIRLPVNQWPMPRAAVRYALRARQGAFRDECRGISRRSRACARGSTPRSRGEAAVCRSTRRSSAGEPGCCAISTPLGRENGELRGRATYSFGERAEISLNVTGAADPDDGAANCALDGSHATVQLGNWLLSAQHARSLVGAVARE